MSLENQKTIQVPIGYLEKIEFRINNQSKKEFHINGVTISKISELLGTLNIILLSKHNIQIYL